MWIKNYKGSDVNGVLFISKINGNSIFIPAAGFRFNSNLTGVGSYGSVWSSSFDADLPWESWNMCFGRSYTNMSDSGRFYGRSIRPVFKK